MDIKAQVVGFLKDRGARDILYRYADNWQTYLLKVKFSDTTDFIFCSDAPNGCPISLKRNLEPQGLIHYPSLTVILSGYDLRKAVGYDHAPIEHGIILTSVDAINGAYIDQARAEVIRLATRYGLFDAAKQGNLQLQSCDKRSAASMQNTDYEGMVEMAGVQARQAYTEHEATIPFNPYIPYDSLSDSELVSFLDNNEALVQSKAGSLFADNLADISNAILRNHLANRQLDLLTSKDGSHSRFRAIADCITDQKTVTLDVVRDNVSLIVKYDAEYLRNCAKNMENQVWNWHMDATSRKKFEEVYGRRAMLYMSDIKSIRHGKKTLWTSGN